MNAPFISIITITYNDTDLQRTLESVSKQKTSLTFEHIIVEGFLNSSTRDLVKNYKKNSSHSVTYIREKDTGRYNAMNKGIKKAKGDYLLFLNGGDHFFNSHSLQAFSGKTKDYDIIYGNIYVSNLGKLNSHSPPDSLDFKYFLRSSLPHQASLIKMSLFKKYGLYDESLQISSDHNFFLLTIVKYHCSYHHINKFISVYYFNGISSDPQKAIQNTREKNTALDNHFTAFTSKNIQKQKFLSKFNTPILFIIFNRPDTSQKVFNEIKKIKPKYLYVAADGPRTNKPGEDKLCEETRKIVTQIDWNCHLHTMFRNVNFGCGSSVSKAITWFFDHVSEGIILEDDCLPNPSFFQYCQYLLKKYRHDTRVCHINGTSFVNQQNQPDSYYFSRYYHVWGWATWKRAWDNYDFTMLSYPQFLQNQEISKLFVDKNIQTFWLNGFQQVYENRLDTWDYQWVYTSLINSGLSIYPFTNMIANIGFDDRATHTTNQNDGNAHRPTSSIDKISNPFFIVSNQHLDNQIYLHHLKLTLDQADNLPTALVVKNPSPEPRPSFQIHTKLSKAITLLNKVFQ